jgi:hypothetical protein
MLIVTKVVMVGLLDKTYEQTEVRTANTGFASGGVTCKFGALCSETRPNAKPENVKGKLGKNSCIFSDLK